MHYENYAYYQQELVNKILRTLAMNAPRIRKIETEWSWDIYGNRNKKGEPGYEVESADYRFRVRRDPEGVRAPNSNLYVNITFHDMDPRNPGHILFIFGDDVDKVWKALESYYDAYHNEMNDYEIQENSIALGMLEKMSGGGRYIDNEIAKILEELDNLRKEVKALRLKTAGHKMEEEQQEFLGRYDPSRRM